MQEQAYLIERFGHTETYYGETAGKAKYQAFLESESGYDFHDFLTTISSCRKDKYYRPQRQQEYPDIKPGYIVEMHDCLEAGIHKGKTWEVETLPRMICGTWVVWLKGYSGCFACEFLRKVEGGGTYDS